MEKGGRLDGDDWSCEETVYAQVLVNRVKNLRTEEELDERDSDQDINVISKAAGAVVIGGGVCREGEDAVLIVFQIHCSLSLQVVQDLQSGGGDR